MTGQDVIVAEPGDGVLQITLNRPEARNAVNRSVAEGIAAALDRLDAADDFRVGVLTGTGPGFCAGMDLKAFLAGEVSDAGDRGFAGIAARGPRKPLVAAVEGFAVGGGLEVALACDLIVAARDARLSLPEVKRGLIAAAGGLLRLPRRIPLHVAMEIALTGEPIAAERACALGLVARVTEPGGCLDEALVLARMIAGNAPLAVEASKRLVLDAAYLGWDDAWERQGQVSERVDASEDAREGAAAFAERRPPAWRGR